MSFSKCLGKVWGKIVWKKLSKELRVQSYTFSIQLMVCHRHRDLKNIPSKRKRIQHYQVLYVGEDQRQDVEVHRLQIRTIDDGQAFRIWILLRTVLWRDHLWTKRGSFFLAKLHGCGQSYLIQLIVDVRPKIPRVELWISLSLLQIAMKQFLVELFVSVFASKAIWPHVGVTVIWAFF